MKTYIQIHPIDNVAVALTDLPAGTCAEGLTLGEIIPQGHKFALSDLSEGASVIKYGSPIGKASKFIPAGSHIHSHNMQTALSDKIAYTYEPASCITERQSFLSDDGTFSGYLRQNGRAGIRNEIWVIPTVGCVNNVAQHIVKEAKQRFSDMPSIDEIIAFTHPYGCSQLGDDQENTRKILADLCMHPNAGGVLLLGLGCENSGVEEVKQYITDFDQLNIVTLVAQETEDEIETALEMLSGLISRAASYHRQPLPLSKLIVGVKCGGSDGLSGITANPLVGQFTDKLTSCGGSVLLTEVPEMFGAETLLFNRCADETVFNQAVKMINDFKDYFLHHQQPIYENPSPGNKAGGITTLEEKSLGCTQKSGSCIVSDVLNYGEVVTANGLSLLSAPGNDLVASTALAAAGAQLILFTTGRGTPFASPVPTMKISSNTPLAEKKSGWIDFDGGRMLTEDSAKCLDAFWQLILETANGQKTKSELAGYHDMAIFKQNVTL